MYLHCNTELDHEQQNQQNLLENTVTFKREIHALNHRYNVVLRYNYCAFIMLITYYVLLIFF